MIGIRWNQNPFETTQRCPWKSWCFAGRFDLGRQFLVFGRWHWQRVLRQRGFLHLRQDPLAGRAEAHQRSNCGLSGEPGSWSQPEHRVLVREWFQVFQTFKAAGGHDWEGLVPNHHLPEYQSGGELRPSSPESLAFQLPYVGSSECFWCSPKCQEPGKERVRLSSRPAWAGLLWLVGWILGEESELCGAERSKTHWVGLQEWFGKT